MPRTHKFWHRNEGEIEFHEEDGKLWYSYRETVTYPSKHHHSSERTFETADIVPDEVITQGDAAIRQHAQKYVERRIKRQKAQADAADRADANLNHPLEFKYQGVLLKGKIVSYVDTALTVQLDEPYQGQKFVIYGFASAMLGRHVYADKGGFTENAIQTAHKMLIDIYNREKHKEENRDVIALVDRLNAAGDDKPIA